MDKMSAAMNQIVNHKLRHDSKLFDNSSTFYHGLLRLINLVKYMEHEKEKQGKGLKMIILKQMLSRLPVLLA